jgi:hypothetical protein
MQSDNRIRDQIESNLSATLELGLDAEEALAEAAGLLSEAEARFARLRVLEGASCPSTPSSR